MPQRNPGRVAQLLSNNNLLSGNCVSGLRSTLGGVVPGLDSGGCVNTSVSSSTAIGPVNGRHFGNPVAAAAVVAAAAASPLNNAVSTSTSSHHHHQPPPLITDTLNACLDVNGTYICTSYSPRCYIIQKVTPNTITVTPHVIGSDSSGPTGGGVTPNNAQIGTSLLPLLSSQNSLPPHKKLGRQSVPSNTNLIPAASSAIHRSPPVQQQSPHGQRQYNNAHVNYPSHLNSRPSPGSSYLPKTPSKSNYVFQKTSQPTLVHNPPPSSISGRVYMNGEVGSTTSVFSGEESMPAMVHSTATAGAGSHYSDNRISNGLKDGTRDQMKSVESNDIEFADNSRRNEPGSGANVSSDISKDDLKRLLLQQLEYYFSPENLASDKFLVSQMDSDHYVYISTLANFNMVKKLTGDIDLVTEVLRDSKNVQVHSDGKRVRPVSHRTVVILRGIPENTPVDEIKALFDSENCPKCNSCEFAFNDSWYVSFESDEDAQRAHRYLREDVREFKGQPIMARIKSRPTTLLAQGAGNGFMKNGYHQPSQVMGPYIPPAYVPGSQTGPSTSVPQAPIYAHSQSVPYPMAPGYNYGPWPNFFGMGPDQISQMYPMNGLAPQQHQQSSNYSKTLPMNPRQRNPNQVRPRRLPSSSSENQGINGVVGSGGTNTAPVAAHQNYTAPARKSNNAPPSLLNIVPNPPTIPLVNPPSHNHSQGHIPHSSVQVSGNAISQNGGRHYPNPISSTHNVDTYHPSGSMRPYRGVNDSRPRSSLSVSNRKGPPRREEEVSYDGPAPSPSTSAKVPSNRGAPLNASVPVPQPPPEVPGPNQQPTGKINFDLEGSAFPPLPGSGQSSGKNGDAVFEGRLSDVVKGVKSMKTTGSSDKDDAKPPITNLPTEIIVSAEENQSTSDVREVSAASPVKDVESEKKPEVASSQTSVQSGKKEFREVGVGSADDTHDIRSSHYKSSVLSGARSKETADKATRTDEALLNGDQSQQGVKTGFSSNSVSPQSSSHSQSVGTRKSATQTTSVKSPISNKRAVPAAQVPNASTSVSVGPEVPYSSRNVTSPVTIHAKSSSSQTSSGSVSSGAHSASSAGRGANAIVAKSNVDNNNSRANGVAASTVGSSMNNIDKDAFPSPGFGKTVPTSKPFPNTNDQTLKEVNRGEADKERKETGQGDGRKSDDCSNDERDGPMRLSYAQVAQAKKDGSSASTSSPVPSNTASNSTPSSVSSSGNGNTSATIPASSSTTNEEKKKSSIKETKDIRAPQKNQRGSRSGDVDRGFSRRGGYNRNRMLSDHSDGGSVTSGSGENGRRIPKPSRSPK